MLHFSTAGKKDLFVSSKELQRVRRIASRKRFVFPCSECKTWRRRCNGFRPCSRCIDSEVAHLCTDSEGEGQFFGAKPGASSATCVEPPLPYMTFKLIFDMQSPVLKVAQDLGKGWSSGPLRRIFALGFNHEQAARLILGVPDWIRSEIGNALDTVEKISAQKRAEDMSNCWKSEMSQLQYLMDCREGILDEDRAASGLSVFTFEPDSQKRKDVSANSAMAGIFGMHREEYLARVANYDLPILFTNLESLKTLLFSAVKAFFNTGQPSEFIFRMVLGTGPGTTCKLIASCTVVVKGPSGKVHQVKRAYRVITADEYDEALARCPGNCLPYAMGDCRSGSQLLAAGAEDMRRESIEMLNRTPQGIAALRQLVTSVLAAGAALAGLAPPMPPPLPRHIHCVCGGRAVVSGSWNAVADHSEVTGRGGLAGGCRKDRSRLDGVDCDGGMQRPVYSYSDNWMCIADGAVYVPSLPLPTQHQSPAIMQSSPPLAPFSEITGMIDSLAGGDSSKFSGRTLSSVGSGASGPPARQSHYPFEADWPYWAK